MYHGHRGLNSSQMPGTTTVWVGETPYSSALGHHQLSNQMSSLSLNGSQATSDPGTYFVTSVQQSPPIGGVQNQQGLSLPAFPPAGVQVPSHIYNGTAGFQVPSHIYNGTAGLSDPNGSYMLSAQINPLLSQNSTSLGSMGVLNNTSLSSQQNNVSSGSLGVFSSANIKNLNALNNPNISNLGVLNNSGVGILGNTDIGSLGILNNSAVSNMGVLNNPSMGSIGASNNSNMGNLGIFSNPSLGSLGALNSPAGVNSLNLLNNASSSNIGSLDTKGMGNLGALNSASFSSMGSLPNISNVGISNPFLTYTPLPYLYGLNSNLVTSLQSPGLQQPQTLASPIGQPVDVRALLRAKQSAPPTLQSTITSESPSLFFGTQYSAPVISKTSSFPNSDPSGIIPLATKMTNTPTSSLVNGHVQSSSAELGMVSLPSVNNSSPYATFRREFSTSSDQTDDQGTSGIGSSIASSPSDLSSTSFHQHDYKEQLDYLQQTTNVVQQDVVPPCYERPPDKTACLRCWKKVYAIEKLGPVKDSLYHKTCFTCVVCRTTLNLKNFHHNEHDLADLNVYCMSHKPIAKSSSVDSNAIGIQRALKVPHLDRVNDQIRGGPDTAKHVLDSHSVSIRSAMAVPAHSLQSSNKVRVDTWVKKHRDIERVPPPDVVRHDGTGQLYEGSRSLYYDYNGD